MFHYRRLTPGAGSRSGDTTPCVVTAPGGQFVIEDTDWTEGDYVAAIEQAGLAVAAIDYPRPRDPAAWSTDEASAPPCIVIEARKAGRPGSPDCSRGDQADRASCQARPAHPWLPCRGEAEHDGRADRGCV
jgi:hypothetical protein